MGTTYKQAGVDIVAGDDFVDAIMSAMQGTHGPDVIPIPGGFAGEIMLNHPGMFGKKYKNPIITATTDGVGTKLKLAFQMNKHDTIGTDLVAMSVNDLITNGSKPVLFLDYIAFSGVPNSVQVEVVKGIAKACLEAECALLGGERAELPGFYHAGEYDLAGFAVGVIEKNKRVDGHKVVPGDAVIGVASSGVHSNGYSLVRKIVEDAKLDLHQYYPEFGKKLGEELLTPTYIYVKLVQRLLNHYRTKAGIKSIAHITGAGLPGNVPRVIPKNCSIKISKKAWPRPAVFDFLQKQGDVDEKEMFDVFNMGIGLVLVTPQSYAPSVLKQIEQAGHKGYVIGKVKRGNNTVELVD